MGLDVRLGSYITRPNLVSEAVAPESHMTQARRFLWFAVVLLSAVISCGPEITEPASTNITGRWTSSDVIGPLSNISLEVVQASDGSVQGQWAGVSSSPNPPCPPELGSAPTGPLNGLNTVLALQLSLLGIGNFDGQVRDESTLRGSFTSCGLIYPMTFTRVIVAP